MNRRSFLSWLAVTPIALPAAAASLSTEVPRARQVLTLGADVQTNRIEIPIADWRHDVVLRPTDLIRLGVRSPFEVLEQVERERSEAEAQGLVSARARLTSAPLASTDLPAGWAGASGGEGRGRALQVAARPPIVRGAP